MRPLNSNSRHSRTSLMGPLLAAASTVVVLGGGCAYFDREDRVEDTRILAIKTEPAEVKFSPLYSLLPPDQRPPGFVLP